MMLARLVYAYYCGIYSRRKVIAEPGGAGVARLHPSPFPRAPVDGHMIFTVLGR